MVVKRYSNRRLYDTDESRYVTLDEVAERIRAGSDIRFVDAPTGDDITQTFLAQIILEGRGAAKLLPVPLLYRMVRMGDDALAEFFGRYVTWALDVYLRLKQGARSMSSYGGAFGQMPQAAGEALARWLGSMWGQSQGAPPSSWPSPPNAPGWGPPGGAWSPPSPAEAGFPPPPAPELDDAPPEPETGASTTPDRSPAPPSSDQSGASSELAAMRAEIEALKQAIRDAVGASGAKGTSGDEPETSA